MYDASKSFKKAITPQRYWAFHALSDSSLSKLRGHLYLLTHLSQTTALYPGKSGYLCH